MIQNCLFSIHYIFFYINAISSEKNDNKTDDDDFTEKRTQGPDPLGQDNNDSSLLCNYICAQTPINVFLQESGFLEDKVSNLSMFELYPTQLAEINEILKIKIIE